MQRFNKRHSVVIVRDMNNDVARMAAQAYSIVTMALYYFVWLWYFIYNSFDIFIFLKDVYIGNNTSYIARNILL